MATAVLERGVPAPQAHTFRKRIARLSAGRAASRYLAQVLEGENGDVASVGIESIHRGAGKNRVVCFPHAGGSATWYQAWAKAARELDVSLDAVCYPGHAGLFESAWAESIHHVADLVYAQLVGSEPDTVLFGHSMGALVAFEVALCAKRRGAPFAALHFSGSRPPCVPIDNKRADLSDSKLVEAIGAMAPGSPNALECEEIAELFLPIVRHDFRIAEGYESSDHLGDTHIHLHCGQSDAEFLPKDAPEWRSHTWGRIDIHEYEGDHFFLESKGCQILSGMFG